jgi:thiamine-phosphate pyrophosphorylase
LKVDNDSLLLYAVTDRTWLGNTTLEEQVKAAIQGGVTFLQLREKELPVEEFIKLAVDIKKITGLAGIPLIINDELEVALACEADGVHVGQSDMTAGEVRSKIGEDKILGVSVQTAEQAVLAEKEGADYLGVGAVFTTSTKLDADTVSFNSLKAICEAVSIPVVAIGGINRDNALELSGSGISGIAVVSAIFAQRDIKAAAEELAELAARIVKD